MNLPSFHPCVRLNRWKEKPGELSFVPPDGKFMLAGYEVDLLPYDLSKDDQQLPSRGAGSNMFLPATVDLRTGLGSSGSDFEAKLIFNSNFPGLTKPTPASAIRPGLGSGPNSRTASGINFANLSANIGGPHSGTTGAPGLEAVSVSIPFPADVRAVMDFRLSRGDATFNVHTKTVEWKVPTTGRDGSVSGTATLTGSVSGTATLTGTVAGPLSDDPVSDQHVDPTMEEYYPSSPTLTASTPTAGKKGASKKHLMPRTISTSFTVKGWLPSGIKVEALNVDTKRSKGLGDGVKPYKGVKYMTVSRRGVERRVGNS